MSTIAPVELSRHRPGVDVRFDDGPGPQASAEWRLGDWTLRFVRLDPHQRWALDPAAGAAHVKVVTGRLAEPDRGAYAAARTVRHTGVAADGVTAGSDGALVTVLTAAPDAAGVVRAIDELRFAGPHADALAWETFEDRYHAVTPYFDGLDAHLAPGFHLLDRDGAEIAHVFVWAAGPGVDLSTHDHGRAPGPHSPAFAEVHWVLCNGSGSGGMYETAAPGAAERERYPVQQGHEHGPFFAFDPATGLPGRRANGAVDYPWHGRHAGPATAAGPSYDVVVAFEITAPYARVVP